MELVWNKILNPFKRSNGNPVNSSGSEQYAIITLRDALEFDYKKSVALCVGIDRQFHHQYASQSLGNIVIRDAEAMGKAFIDSLGLDDNQVKVRVPSSQPDDCKKSGVRTLFVESAKNVEESGIFIFYFAGHGFLVNGRCVLAPADFAGKEDLTTGISGDDLVEWLYEAKCKANQVLVIMDCCYADDIGITLTSPDNMLIIKPTLFVMCGCAAREKCMSVDALGHSVFTYFFLRYLEKHKCRGEFAVKQAMQEIAELCLSLSSLLVSYDHEKGELQLREMHATLDRLDIQEDIECMDETDSGDHTRFGVLVQFFKEGQPKTYPHQAVDSWLRSSAIHDSLCTLYTKVSFSEELHEGIFCSMLYSAASIQYGYDKTRLKERNLFIMIAISVIQAIGFAYPRVNATIFHLISGLQHYSQPTLVGAVDRSSLNELFAEMCQEASKPDPDNIANSHEDIVANENGGDEVDFQPAMMIKVNM